MNNKFVSKSGKDVYKALKKIEARTQLGISYHDYNKLHAEAKVEWDEFVRMKDPLVNVNFVNHVGKSYIHYLRAKQLWGLKINFRQPSDIVICDSWEKELVKKAYPKAATKEFGGIHKTKYYNLIELMKNLWNNASKELNKAANYL